MAASNPLSSATAAAAAAAASSPSFASSMTVESVRAEKLRHCRRPPEGKPLFSEREVRIICIGAGASGLCFAYKLQRSFQKFRLVMYEKNPDISGTWWENRYPGCACDVPAHNYTFSWEPSTDASAVYVSSEELYQYFKRFAQKHDLDKFIRLEQQVVGAKWNGDSWDVEIKDCKSDSSGNGNGRIYRAQCDILINATGVLNNWKFPAIPGLHDFKGQLLHSANWDPSASLEGKTVGLIGNGSSGIQILPAIQPRVKKLVTFLRGTSWISPVQGLGQRTYTQQEKDVFRSKPDQLTAYRKMNESVTNCLFSTFIRGSDTQIETQADFTRQMQEKLSHSPELAAKLIPQWSLGCRRLTPGINYLESLGQDNVQVQLGEIRAVTQRGCVDAGGVEHPLDVLICATGFDVSFKPRFPVVVQDTGHDLQQAWAQEPRSYLGLAAADVPNYMLFLGPNCPIGNGPVLPVIEVQADYMLKWIDRWQTENMRSFSPKKEAVDDFVEHVNAYMPRTVWTENCRSWYKNGSEDGRVTALWPGSSLHYMEAMEFPRHDDFVVTYSGNRFSWMGNGYSQTEMDPDADWAYYIRDFDDSPLLGKSRRRKALTGRERDSEAEVEVVPL
ncbi:hypothetical protein LTR99_010433 [Exophiala xenobiotica]|uniref:Uncharacterized protein n=1 Tax=Vermiconidia calcicola TaxID=1690605 RepID=A0AAV9PUY8_9PEZI|nr:hypothetical protein LTR92_007614 [Exophiala xenobiotica]KAK5528589.1 hypothetical protein LTR25_010202 [Vermiconidia calcicola]KAK5267737.1 hypothetical protein LTR96_007065 [Exophiala xenobiotica]KAK5292289.1 hypothetical protein LTR99_010433 [Exophiala xenobiotica]KAK5427179.1 hypothetical protein LTR34_009188 [Exophiala xenobiotica]